MDGIKILLVDDELDILEFLAYNLKKEGFKVLLASNGEEAIKIAEEEIPHLILLDIMMPQMDGVETCQHLRTNPKLINTLIAFLTARHEEYTQIIGFEAGADDYIQKPIRPRLLLSRIKALLRRHEGMQESNDHIIRIGKLYINREKYSVFLDNKAVELAKKEFEILWLLVSKPGKVFGRDEIYRYVWGSAVIVGNRTIDVHISKLRDKIGSNYIKTVKGIGYKVEF